MNNIIQKKAGYAEKLVYMAYTKKVSEIEKDVLDFHFDKDKINSGLVGVVKVAINVGFFTGIFAQPLEVSYMSESEVSELVLQVEKENYAINFLCALNKYDKGHETDIFQFKIIYLKKKHTPIIQPQCCEGYDPSEFVYLASNGEITPEDPRAMDEEIIEIKSKVFDHYSNDQDLMDAFNAAIMTKEGYIYKDGDFTEFDMSKEIQNIFGNIFGGMMGNEENDEEEDEEDE